MKETTPLFRRAVALIKNIPSGKVLTYGRVAQLIGAPGCGRHVSFILASSSKKYNLPWHRVISAGGMIANHGKTQKHIRLLKKEDIYVHRQKLSLTDYEWRPSKGEVMRILKGLPKHISYYAR